MGEPLETVAQAWRRHDHTQVLAGKDQFLAATIIKLWWRPNKWHLYSERRFLVPTVLCVSLYRWHLEGCDGHSFGFLLALTQGWAGQ